MTKYNAKKVVVDWFTFDSKAEAEYYGVLLNAKSVKEIKMQPCYVLQEKYTNSEGDKIRAIEYVWDFEVQSRDGKIGVIDIKWMATPEAKLKRKMFMYKYPDIPLLRLVKYKWERVDYFDNEKRKRDNKKKSKNLLK